MDTITSIWFDDGNGGRDRYFNVGERLSDRIDSGTKEMLYHTVRNGSSATINLSSKELMFVYHTLEEPTPGHVCVLKSKSDLVTGLKIVRLLTITKDKNYYRSTFNVSIR